MKTTDHGFFTCANAEWDTDHDLIPDGQEKFLYHTDIDKADTDFQEAVTKTARSIFPIVDKAGDEPTADLLTQRMQIHEKNAWMLRSLLES